MGIHVTIVNDNVDQNFLIEKKVTRSKEKFAERSGAFKYIVF
jgi:hypothetical protein